MAKKEEKASYIISVELLPVETKNDGVPGAPVQPGDGSESQKQAEEGVKSNKNAAKAMVRQMAGKVANTALSNYGNITGDYVTQQNIQTVIGEGTAIAGAVALGPAGMAIYAVDKLLQGYNYISNLKRSERDAKFKQERVFISTERS